MMRSAGPGAAAAGPDFLLLRLPGGEDGAAPWPSVWWFSGRVLKARPAVTP